MINKLEVRFIFVLFFIFQGLFCQAIETFSFYKNYTVNEGLPSSKIYHMIQDSKGYIWFATENGVARFDGYDFLTFTTNNGLPTNSTIKLYEDYKGRIWFLSYQGAISYYLNGEISPYKFAESIRDMEINFFDNIYVDSTDNLWITPFLGGLYKMGQAIETILPTGNFTCRSHCRISLVLRYFDDGYILGIKERSDSVDNKLIEKIDNTYYLNYPNSYFAMTEHKKFQKKGSDEFFISLEKNLRHIKNNKIVAQVDFSKDILDIYSDQNNNLWISTSFDGIYMYPNCDLSADPRRILKGYSVSKVLEDKSGNYWFSTTDNGVYLVPSFDFRSFNSLNIDLENEIIYSMALKGNQMFVSTNNKKLYSFLIDGNNLLDKNEFVLDGDMQSIANDILTASDGSLWVTGSEYLHYTMKGEKIPMDSLTNRYGYELCELPDNVIIMTTQTGFKTYRDSQLHFPNLKGKIYDRTFAVHGTDDGTLWFGNLYGLHVLEEEKMQIYDANDPVLSTRISDINSIGNQIWVGTFDNGVVILNRDQKIYLTENDGLSSNRTKVIFLENEKNVWIGTNYGLNHIIIENKDSLKYSIDAYTIWDGLPSNEINDILKYNGVIWLGTDRGLVSFYPDILRKEYYQPSLYFENIIIQEDKHMDFSRMHDLKYNENDITISYKAICYKHPGHVDYAYRLSEQEGWIDTRNTSVRFIDLNPGDYSFEIKAKSIDGIWSEPIEFSFLIHKHFTQTYLFIIGLIIFITAIILFVFWSILKNQKNRETLKQKVILAEQQAIRSQMNPHFLFNSLNSIQHLILSKEEQVANYYLTNLSKLMRKILDNSKHTTIPLKEELENINLYLELEKFRFESHFDYKVEIDDTVKVEEMVIPSMIIQPYLENAIWHGLVPKGVKGNLLLLLTRNKFDHLLVIVEDDGIGRIEAEKIAKRRKNYKSKGMKNTRERINLLNRLFGTNLNVKVVDLFDNNQNPKGTRIELTFDL